MTGDARDIARNPFRSQRIRPGAVDYLFDGENDLDRLIAALQVRQWKGQIVGPHGSGKSTLLAALAPRLIEERLRVHAFELHDGQRRIPDAFWRLPPVDEPTIIVIDGYEQLSWLQKLRARRRCTARRWGLLVTTHAPAGGLPLLMETRTSPELARRVVETLLAHEPDREPPITEADVDEAFARHDGDLRETLFELYDRYEERRDER